jgi:hypothetical protein
VYVCASAVGSSAERSAMVESPKDSMAALNLGVWYRNAVKSVIVR